MVDMPEAIGVVRIGRARRYVGEQNHAAAGRKAFGQRRYCQGSSGDPPLVLQKVGMASIVMHEPPGFQQGQRIALQFVSPR